MTAEERTILEQSSHAAATNPMKVRELGLGFVLTLGSILCGAALFWLLTYQVPNTLLFVSAPLLVLLGIILFFFGANLTLGWLGWAFTVRRFRRTLNPKVDEALRAGRVIVKQVIATAVIELEEFEDEGAGWLYQIDSGVCLLLKGQKYEPTEPNAPWPCSEFEIVRTATHGLWLGLFCTGQALEPRRIIPLSEFPEKFLWSEAEELRDGSMDEVVKELQQKK